MRHLRNSTRPADDGAPDDHRLRGDLGLWSIVFMVVAAAAPLTVVAGVVPLGIALGNGPAFPAVFVLCTVVLLVFSVGFTAMTPFVRDAGAFSTYVRVGLGRLIGTGAACLALATYAAVLLGVLAYLGSAAADLVQVHTGFGAPWWVWAMGAAAVVSWFGFCRISLSGRVLGLLLVCELALVLVLDLVVAVDPGPEGRSTALFDGAAFFSGSPGIAIMFAIASFIGFESTAVYRDETRDPDRTLPRATAIALLLVGGFYALSSWALVTAWGEDAVVAEATARPGTLVITTLTDRLGTPGSTLGSFLLVSSLLAAVLSFHNVAARYLFTLARDSGLGSRVGRVHTDSGSPRTASLAVSVCTVLLLAVFVALGWHPVTQVFSWLVGAAAVGILILLTLTSASATIFFRRLPVGGRSAARRLAPPVAFLALATCLVLTVVNLPVLTGGSAALSVWILVAAASLPALGAIIALRHPTRD